MLDSESMRDVPSPCVKVCELDATSGFCRGCLRTLEEIGGWPAYTAREKRAVLRRIELRKRAAAGPLST